MTGRADFRDSSARCLGWPLGLLFFFVVSPASSAPPEYLHELQQTSHREKLAAQRYWQLLLHVRRDLLGQDRSEVDDPDFFLSSSGRVDPGAELDATLQAFFDPVSASSDTQHPQCRFPARYAWLKSHLQFDPSRLPEQACPRYQEWRNQMNAGSISLIFASAYMNNPASIYGHTFLRLNALGRSSEQPLLDYTVNYAAEVTTHNGILFALYGLSGGYRGRFSTMPYYIKVQEYSNLEARDLWEYELAISTPGTARLLPHLWEMASGTKPYYFLNRNCSYELMPVLEITEPGLKLKDEFVFKAIPSDTLRAVVRQPGLVKDIRKRPSQVSRMLTARRRLTAREIEMAESFVRNPAVAPEGWSSEPAGRRALVIDSALDLYRYRYGFKRDRPAKVKEKESQLLLLRNQAPAPAPLPPDPSSAHDADSMVAPHLSHRTGRVGLGYGFSNRSHFEELTLRPAVHDQDDPPSGYLPGSQLQMFLTRLRYDNDHHLLNLQQFTLVDLISLSPWDRWVRHPSWKVNTGLQNAMDLNRDPGHTLYYGLNGGPGVSFNMPGIRSGLIYMLAEGDLGLGAPFRDGYRAGGGGVGGVSWMPCSWWRARFEGGYLHYPVGNPGGVSRLKLTQSVPVMKRLESRIVLERQNSYKEALFSLLWYL